MSRFNVGDKVRFNGMDDEEFFRDYHLLVDTDYPDSEPEEEDE